MSHRGVKETVSFQLTLPSVLVQDSLSPDMLSHSAPELLDLVGGWGAGVVHCCAGLLEGQVLSATGLAVTPHKKGSVDPVWFDEFGDSLEDVGRQAVHVFDRSWEFNSNYRRKL